MISNENKSYDYCTILSSEEGSEKVVCRFCGVMTTAFQFHNKVVCRICLTRLEKENCTRCKADISSFANAFLEDCDETSFIDRFIQGDVVANKDTYMFFLCKTCENDPERLSEMAQYEDLDNLPMYYSDEEDDDVCISCREPRTGSGICSSCRTCPDRGN